jgi:ribonuclease HII
LAKQPESLKNGLPRGSKRAKRPTALELYFRLEAFDRGYVPVGGGFLAGVDEAGRGALAGPVVAAAVVLPADSQLLGVNDSKCLAEAKREACFQKILEHAVSIGIGVEKPAFIDLHNVLNATLAAMARAVSRLRVDPAMILVDGRDRFESPRIVVPVVGADRRSLVVAAASVVAKVARDRLMRKLHARYPAYNFLENKGYGTAEHLDAIARHGRIAEHRRTYRLKTVEKSLRLL